MLTLAKRLSPDKSVSTIKSIRDGFRLGISEADPNQAFNLLKEAESKLGFLKIVTPRRPIDSAKSAGVQTFIVEKGQVVPGNVTYDRATTNSSTGINTWDMKRHNQLVRRQHFLDRK